MHCLPNPHTHELASSPDCVGHHRRRHGDSRPTACRGCLLNVGLTISHPPRDAASNEVPGDPQRRKCPLFDVCKILGALCSRSAIRSLSVAIGPTLLPILDGLIPGWGPYRDVAGGRHDAKPREVPNAKGRKALARHRGRPAVTKLARLATLRQVGTLREGLLEPPRSIRWKVARRQGIEQMKDQGQRCRQGQL